jgi:hypothetical protein
MGKTIEPVTTSGWYELDDGRVQRFYWQQGRLFGGLTVNSWAEVPTLEGQMSLEPKPKDPQVETKPKIPRDPTGSP